MRRKSFFWCLAKVDRVEYAETLSSLGYILRFRYSVRKGMGRGERQITYAM